jgi:hypothetical protein
MIAWTENKSINKSLFQVFECKFGCIKYFIHSKSFTFNVLGKEYICNKQNATLEDVQRQFEHALRTICIEINKDLNIFQIENEIGQATTSCFTSILETLKKYSGEK